MPTIDRIEGSRALLDFEGEIIEVPRSALPEGATEGSVLVFAIASDADKRREAEARLARLRAGSPDDKEIDL
jgi:hypothetical protein